MKKLYATVRIERATGKPAIFYRNSFKHYGAALSCYTREEQHTDACFDYYYNKTHPARTDAERALCDGLIAHYVDYCAKYGDEKLVIRSRLTDNE